MNAISRRPVHSPALPLNRLSAHQHLLVFAMRKWRLGVAGLADASQSLFRIFGIYYIEAAIEAFETLMTALDDTPEFASPNPSLTRAFVSPGEMAVVKLITALQANDQQTARSLAGKIGGPDAEVEVLAAARLLGQSLDARRVLFTLRGYQPLAVMAVVGNA